MYADQYLNLNLLNLPNLREKYTLKADLRILSFQGTRNPTSSSTKIGDFDCGVSCEDFSSVEMTILRTNDSLIHSKIKPKHLHKSA